MTKSFILIAVLGVGAFTASTASAHPGANILTTGSSEGRTAMTSGMRFEEVGAVHVFRGKEAITGAAPVPLKNSSQGAVIIIEIDKRAYRSFRHLRTQGFYSGTGPKSRRYTQGFYSGD